MNKTAIKNFAVWARNKLIADITYKAGLIGVSEKGIAQPLPQSSKDLQFFDIGTKDYSQVTGSDIVQRNALVRAIQEKESTSDYNTAFHAIIEEVAYTWFNRLIAIRFMEVNDYLPSGVRVLSSENPAKNEPDFVTNPFDTDMEFTTAEQDKIMQLKDENKLDELFRMLFIRQCNKLHEILPELFEETNNYTELLLSISFTDSDGVVYHLVHDIDEKDFDITTQDEEGKTPGQVEIIGWMYQYYNIEPKDETFALLKKNVKITKERIPAATQLFTPDWIVRYMVENSLGRLWVEGHPNDSLKENWKYYLEEAEQEASVQAQLEQIRAKYRKLNPEEIKVIDPCMGSGHILVYCFDVLMQIYESQGYTQRDAAQSILENNLYGLDIDKRAAQLAYFAVMMKARQYDRRIFSRDIKPHVYAIEESNSINRGQLKYFGADLSPIERNKAMLQMDALLDTMTDAKEYGSILSVGNYEWDLLYRFAESVDDKGQLSLDAIGNHDTKLKLVDLIEISHAMTQKYDVVVTNPPYMAISNAGDKVSSYVKLKYPDSKVDMYAVFIEKCSDFAKPTGYQAMITQHTWMFIASYEGLRKKLMNERFVNMAHLGARAFGEVAGEVVQTTAFVKSNYAMKTYLGQYIRLVAQKSEAEKEEAFADRQNHYVAKQSDYELIPRTPFVYWANKNVVGLFKSIKTVRKHFTVRNGLTTGNNDIFLRLWFEVNFKQKHKWFPCNKGGQFRKWYGNREYLIDWENDGYALKNFFNAKGKQRSTLRSIDYNFKPCIVVAHVASGELAYRFIEGGFISESAVNSIYQIDDNIDFMFALAALNSKPCNYIVGLFNPTLGISPEDILNIPLVVSNTQEVIAIAEECVQLSRNDWDSFEISWDFQQHPLMSPVYTIAEAFSQWESECIDRFTRLKANEEELNRIFIDIYGLQDELTPKVEDKSVTVHKADVSRDIRSFLSYAVGCMFGRYSLDESGLAYAGGEWDNSKYYTFVPNEDNCVPITDEEYFEDDIVGLFCAWLKKVYGEGTLEENLDFIAKALGNKGATSREVIRNYFLNDFMKDHIKTYHKRPIYWLFDSGKQNGFKALVYMHRWNADTVGNLRVEYLHKMQHTYEREIIRMQEIVDNSSDIREVSKATKRKDKLQKQLKETMEYDAKLAHIALSRIEIDLDDGVKVNYEKVQTGRDGKKMQILAKI